MSNDPRIHFAPRMKALVFFENKNKSSQTFVFKLLVACVVFLPCLKWKLFIFTFLYLPPSTLPLPPPRSKLTTESFPLLWSVWQSRDHRCDSFLTFCDGNVTEQSKYSQYDYAEYPARPFLSKAIWLVIVGINAFGAPIKFQKIVFSGSVVVFKPSGNGIRSCYFIIHDGLILFPVFLQTNFTPTWVWSADVQLLVKQYRINLSCPMQIFQMRNMFQDC